MGMFKKCLTESTLSETRFYRKSDLGLRCARMVSRLPTIQE
jgi:hypothetical protein